MKISREFISSDSVLDSHNVSDCLNMDIIRRNVILVTSWDVRLTDGAVHIPRFLHKSKNVCFGPPITRFSGCYHCYQCFPDVQHECLACFGMGKDKGTAFKVTDMECRLHVTKCLRKADKINMEV